MPRRSTPADDGIQAAREEHTAAMEQAAQQEVALAYSNSAMNTKLSASTRTPAIRRYHKMRYSIMKYLRISSEDIDLDGLDKYESNSIAHQRTLLDDFISKMPEFASCDILEAVDDGRTGTNFNRPGIQEVLDLAQRGKVQCIVVKDLSRFGRNYLEVGDYLEQLFPTWGVRFISIIRYFPRTRHHFESVYQHKKVVLHEKLLFYRPQAAQVALWLSRR